MILHDDPQIKMRHFKMIQRKREKIDNKHNIKKNNINRQAIKNNKNLKTKKLTHK